MARDLPAHMLPSITDDLTERLCELLRAGTPVATACRLVGISKSAFWKWHKAGEMLRVAAERGQDISPTERTYLNWYDQIDKARGEFEAELIGIIVQKARDGDDKGMKAAEWLLERMFPSNWSKTSIHASRSEVTGEVQVVVTPPKRLDAQSAPPVIEMEAGEKKGEAGRPAPGPEVKRVERVRLGGDGDD